MPLSPKELAAAQQTARAAEIQARAEALCAALDRELRRRPPTASGGQLFRVPASRRHAGDGIRPWVATYPSRDPLGAGLTQEWHPEDEAAWQEVCRRYRAVGWIARTSYDPANGRELALVPAPEEA